MYVLPLQWLNIKWAKKCTYNPLQLVSHLATRCLCGWSIWPNVNLTWSLIWQNINLTWPKISSYGGVHLTKCQPDPKSHLTKCQPDPKPHLGGSIWPNINLTISLTICQPDPKPHPGGSICQSAERSSVFLSTLQGYGLASHRSFLTKDQNNILNHLYIYCQWHHQQTDLRHCYLW